MWISFDTYELYFVTLGSQTIKHTVKYTKYSFAYCRPLIADMLLMGGAIRQHCASCHVTAISYVYSTSKMSSFFRMSYYLNALIFGGAVALGWCGGLVVGRQTCDVVVAGSRPGHDAAA